MHCVTLTLPINTLEQRRYGIFQFIQIARLGYVRLRASTHRFLIIGFLCSGRVENYRSVWVECANPFAEFYAAHVSQPVIEHIGIELLFLCKAQSISPA